jgi:hypothetical protein
VLCSAPFTDGRHITELATSDFAVNHNELDP